MAKNDKSFAHGAFFIMLKDIIIGSIINNVTVLSEYYPYIDKKGFKIKRYMCLCHCGKKFTPTKYRILEKSFSSCGCIRGIKLGKFKKTHGLHDKPIYGIWAAMVSRCNNQNNKNFKHYGGRGISVCEQWLDPGTFINWAFNTGYKNGLTLDRVENDLGYYPDNCHFVSMTFQNNNKRNNIVITHNSQTKTISQWAVFYNIKVHKLYHWYCTKKESFELSIYKSKINYRIFKK